MDGYRSHSPQPPAGFDFTVHMRRLCRDIASRLDELRHIDVQRVAIRCCQTRKAALHGIQATLTPLRFEQGALTTWRNGRRWTIERLYDDSGREMLYLLSFYLPRFQNQTFKEKLATVFHELANRWFELEPPAELCSFLRMDFRELRHAYGAIYGAKIRTPKLFLASPAAAKAMSG
jgi:hypothetical protein